jgi:hypothetical protein
MICIKANSSQIYKSTETGKDDLHQTVLFLDKA